MDHGRSQLTTWPHLLRTSICTQFGRWRSNTWTPDTWINWKYNIWHKYIMLSARQSTSQDNVLYVIWGPMLKTNIYSLNNSQSVWVLPLKFKTNWLILLVVLCRMTPLRFVVHKVHTQILSRRNPDTLKGFFSYEMRGNLHLNITPISVYASDQALPIQYLQYYFLHTPCVLTWSCSPHISCVGALIELIFSTNTAWCSWIIRVIASKTVK